MRLKVTLQHGLEVIVPTGYKTARVPQLLERKKEWIRAAIDRVEANRKYLVPEPEWRLPMEIALPAVGRIWQVEVRETVDPWVSVRESGDGRLLMLRRIAKCRWENREENRFDQEWE